MASLDCSNIHAIFSSCTSTLGAYRSILITFLQGGEEFPLVIGQSLWKNGRKMNGEMEGAPVVIFYSYSVGCVGLLVTLQM